MLHETLHLTAPKYTVKDLRFEEVSIICHEGERCLESHEVEGGGGEGARRRCQLIGSKVGRGWRAPTP